MTHLSIVSPVYHAESLIDELIKRLDNTLLSLTDQYEIILVEDGGKDQSWRKIKEHCANNSRIKGILLSRNFGQHAAIAAGIEAARGEWIVVMDCDLQDQPEEIPYLYQKAQEGYEIVLASRVNRQEGKLTQYFSKGFYRILSFLSGSRYDSTTANFGIYHRKVVGPLLQIQSSLRYFPSMVNWIGFHQTVLPVKHAQRPEGKSSYTFRKKCRLALDVMLSYSDKPLRLIVGFGIAVSLIAFSIAIYIICKALLGEISVLGYASLAVSITFFSGVIISVLGILGLYIGKIFESLKAKPTYLVREKLND